MVFPAALAVRRRVTTVVQSGVTFAATWPRRLTWMRRVGRGEGVGLPDVHLRTAVTVVADGPGLRHVPVLQVGLACDELQVVRTLCVTVTSAVLGARHVASLPKAAV